MPLAAMMLQRTTIERAPLEEAIAQIPRAKQPHRGPRPRRSVLYGFLNVTYRRLDKWNLAMYVQCQEFWRLRWTL